jgi:hypothetical protein
VEVSHRSCLLESILLDFRLYSFRNHPKHTAFGSRRPSGPLRCPQLTESLVSLLRDYFICLNTRKSFVPIVCLDLFLNIS